MTAYRWKTASHMRGDAQIVGEVCERLSADGNLTPAALVDEGRPIGSPLHAMFEWDDAKAAEAYRETQAGDIIRSIEIVIEGTEEPTRAFVAVSLTGETGSYSPIEVVLRDDRSKASLIKQAKRDMDAFARKYRMLKELAGEVGALMSALDSLDGEQ